MSEKVAVRNVRLCEKDCLCLYVCPTGASDTENSVIDAEKCIGCGACADACPARAISLVPREYPLQQAKTGEVAAALRRLAGSKAEQETIAAGLPGPLAEAVRKSNRIMAEDLLRESGYMLPQSGNARALLEEMLGHSQEPGFPAEAAEYLLAAISFNEAAEKKEEESMEIWKCSVCGYILKALCRKISDARSAGSPLRSS
ncbi:MAG: 4Fe-4S binding protein [Firmicutes bacterium]|nr:4Fe-4S binding protein [Bacillota bacterium]